MSAKQVLVIPPMKSPTTGRLLGWTMTHDPDCHVPAARMRSHPWAQYVLRPVSQIPPGVGRCSKCGGGR